MNATIIRVFLVAILGAVLACSHANLVTGSGGGSGSGNSSAGSGNSSAGSGNSSAGSGNSSAGSGNSSAGSGDSSAGSNNSSAGSNNSSAGSGDSSGNSSASGDSSAGSGGSSGNSSAGSAGSSDASANTSAGSSGSSQASVASSQASEGTSANSSASSEGSTRATGGGLAQGTIDSARLAVGPVLSTSVIGATAAGIGIAIWALTKPQQDAVKSAEVAEAFFRVNARQLRHDLARGAGPSIEDLAAAAQIRRAHLPRFARLLCDHRDTILDLVDPSELTAQRAQEALEHIGALAREDPLLQQDYLAFVERARAPAVVAVDGVVGAGAAPDGAAAANEVRR